jgi:homoserine dehydrogenase
VLGLGQVGQAVARLAADRTATASAGIRFRLEQALVADVTKPRRCPRPARLTSNASAFLRGQYDVVVEALGQVEPARTLVARLLGRGTSVVTANKALVAEHGPQLEAIAVARGCAFRYEATALSAVPFLGMLADRPLVASVDRVVAIVNGTSNFLLTSLAEPQITFDHAVALAQAQGYAEPDPSRDLDGLDAADKLVLLASLFGWGRLSREALEVRGIRQVTAADLEAARSLGGTIKAVVAAERRDSGVRAFVGPAFLSASEPLAALGGALNGIRLDGRYVSNLFFSGPGAGPDVTAATLLDDAAYVSSVATIHARPVASVQQVFPVAPVTPWMLRLTFPGLVPPRDAVGSLTSAVGVDVERVAEFSTERSRWLLLAARGRRDVEAAIQQLAATHRVDAVAFRRV